MESATSQDFQIIYPLYTPALYSYSNFNVLNSCNSNSNEKDESAGLETIPYELYENSESNKLTLEQNEMSSFKCEFEDTSSKSSDNLIDNNNARQVCIDSELSVNLFFKTSYCILEVYNFYYYELVLNISVKCIFNQKKIDAPKSRMVLRNFVSRFQQRTMFVFVN